MLFLIAQFVWSVVTNANYEWDVFAHYFFAEPVLIGIGYTLSLTAISAVIGFTLGTVLALGRLSKSPLLQRRLVVVHLVLPLGAARRADHRLVQPRLPVPDARSRHAVHDRLLDRRVPDRQPDQRLRRRDPRSRPAPGRVFGRDHPRRPAVGRPGTVRSGGGARHPGSQAAVPHHPAAGDALDRPERHQRGHRARQGRLGRLRHRDPRGLLRRPGHLQPQQPRHPAAAGRGRLVHAHHHDPEHRRSTTSSGTTRAARCACCRRRPSSASARWVSVQWARLGDDTPSAPGPAADSTSPSLSMQRRMPASARPRRTDEHHHPGRRPCREPRFEPCFEPRFEPCRDRDARPRRDPQRPQELRRPRSAVRHRPHRSAGRGRRDPRTQRLGQVDAAAHDQPPRVRRPRLGHASTASSSATSAGARSSTSCARRRS